MFCGGAFSREMGGTVRFDYISMKGKAPPNASWPDDPFDERCKKLDKLQQEVSNLYPGFRPTNYILRPGFEAYRPRRFPPPCSV
jgi:hypothetical protein